MSQGLELDNRDNSEEEYQTKVRETFRTIAGFHLNQEIKSQPANTSKAAFLKRRLPVYVDALKRGYPLFLTKLSAGQFSVNLGNHIIRRYSYQDNQLKWQLILDSDDPFAQSLFFQQTSSQNSPLEGEANPLTDPDCLYQMMLDGFAEQKKVYDYFRGIYTQITDKEAAADTTLSLLTTPQLYFDKFKTIYTALQKPKQTPDQLKDAIIEQIVAPANPILEDLPLLEELAGNVSLLHRLFRTSDGSVVPKLNRKTYQRTLAVELLTDPAFLNQPEGIRHPITSYSRVNQVLQFVDRLRIEANAEELKYRISLVVLATMDDARQSLNQQFDRLNIDQKLGQEYVQAVITKYLSDTAADPQPSPTSESMVLFNALYNLDQPIRPSVRRSTAARGSVAETIEITPAYIENLLKRGNFAAEFTRLNPVSRISLLEQIFQHPGMAEYNLSERIVRKIFRTLDLGYSVEAKIFTDRSGARRSPPAEWLKPLQPQILRICAERLGKGDPYMLQVLEKAISEKALPAYLRRKGATPSLQTLVKKSSAINSDVKNEIITKADGLRTVVQMAAQHVLYLHVTGNINAEAETSNFVNQLRGYVLSESLFSSGEAAQLGVLINQQIAILKTQFLHDYFSPDYPLNQAAILMKILKESVRLLGDKGVSPHVDHLLY